MRLTSVPSDPFYSQEWFLSNSGQDVSGVSGTPGADVSAEEAWALADGAGQTVAVVDTGVQSDHPDLAGALWTNPREIVNQVDDDGNGLVDDVKGWSFVTDSADFDDRVGHGTILAGEISATPNNGVGIAGLAFGAKVMPLQVGRSEAINVAMAAKAIEYAARHHVVVANTSFGGAAENLGLEAAIAKHPDLLVVAAAGNTGSNVDSSPFYPCSLKELNVICVASTNSADQLSPFSSYGRSSVDLAAPGEGIASTFKASDLVFAEGTSMAAPLVAATAAMVKQRFPGYDALQIRQKILKSVDKLPALGGVVATSGRLNAAAALRPGDGVLPKTSFPGQEHVFGRTRYALVRVAVDQAGSLLECKLRGGPWVGCTQSTTIKVDTSVLRDGRYRLFARAVDRDGEKERSPAVFHFRVDHQSP